VKYGHHHRRGRDEGAEDAAQAVGRAFLLLDEFLGPLQGLGVDDRFVGCGSVLL
jgi:hypothetical protein